MSSFLFENLTKFFFFFRTSCVLFGPALVVISVPVLPEPFVDVVLLVSLLLSVLYRLLRLQLARFVDFFPTKAWNLRRIIATIKI